MNQRPPNRLRQLSSIFLAATVVVLLVSAIFGSTQSAVSAEDGTWVDAGWDGTDLPDVSLLLESVSSTDPAVEAELIPALREIEGVQSVFSEVLTAGPVAVYLTLSDESDGAVVNEITETAQEVFGESVAVGGQFIADSELLSELNSSIAFAVLPVLVLVAALTTAAFGWKVGAATATAIGLSSLLGGVVGSGIAGSFDGSLGTTALPAVLVALLVSSVLSFRLLEWFKHPIGDDQADQIRRSVQAMVPDLILVLGGLLVTAIFLEVLGGGRAPAVVVMVGAVFGAITVLATLPAVLATLPQIPDETEYRSFQLNIPDGRDFPLAVLAGVACFVLGLGLFATRAPGEGLLDSDTLATSASRSTARLVALGGDPSAAILATMPQGTAPGDVQQWAETVSALETVAWVQTAEGRFERGDLVAPPLTAEGDDEVGETSVFGDELSAVVTPAQSARSAETLELVEMLPSAVQGVGDVSLSGATVDASRTANDAQTHLWVLVACLSIAGGIAVLVLIGDVLLAVITTALRLISTAALLGIYHLITDAPTAVELQLAALIVAAGLGLFEFGLLRRIADADMEDAHRPDFVTVAMRSEGKTAMLGLGVVAVAGLGLLASDLVVVRRFGIALAAGVLIELLLGTWLLRPVVLGEQALKLRTPARSDRAIVGRRGPKTDQPINPEWRRVVSGLLRDEFSFQTDPDNAELDTVFVEGTPLFAELFQHNRRLRSSGLRVQGEGPRLVRVKAVNNGSPVTLAITVDHPSRQLLDAAGKLLGRREAERREGMVWLAQDPSGRYRIQEAVDMGSSTPPPEAPAVAESEERVQV